MEKFKFLEHTADIKFQAFGKSLEEAFENSALALAEIITKKTKINSVVRKKIKAEGQDNESLLYNFLEEFLYLLDAEDFVASEVKVEIRNNKLRANLVGDRASNYKFTNDVKAVTYNNMFVKKQKNKYIVQVVVDV